MRRTQAIYVALMVGIGALPSIAAVSEDEAKRLETDLTPVGAERAGNAAGTIPAWDGGLTATPPGLNFTPGSHHPDPYPSDKPLFKISAANMTQYDAQLSEGHKALLAAYPDSYFMNVYQTRRACAYPPHVYAAVRRNAVTAQHTNDGNGLTGATMATPFPIPKTAWEVLWNHELRYQGFKVTRESAGAAPTKSGDYTIESSLDRWIYRYSDPQLARIEDLDNAFMHFMRQGIAPLNNAGTMMVMHNVIDYQAGSRRGWSYKPGERKVKPAIILDNDAPIAVSEGIRTQDNANIYNGRRDTYDWQLLGKQEKFIVYNNFRFASPDLKYKDILHRQHLNPEPMRYELHRVWAIDAKVKPGKQHKIATRRRMYFDEDSWAGSTAALYDNADKLSRIQEAHLIDYYDQPMCNIASDVVYDIAGARYHMNGMRNEQKPIKFDIDVEPEAFSPEGVRAMGVR